MSLCIAGLRTVPEVDRGFRLVALSHRDHYLYGGALCWFIVALIYFENVHGLELWNLHIENKLNI